MSTRKEYFLQKGKQIQQLTDEAGNSVPAAAPSVKLQREAAKYRDLCPPGTEDSQIVSMIERAKGDSQKIQDAISEMWEDNRGEGPSDWATVSKKGKKKTEAPPRSYREPREPREQSTSTQPQEQNGPPSDRFASSRGRGGANRGRGGFASRGGRGGGRGRGRGGPPTSRGAPRAEGEASGDTETTYKVDEVAPSTEGEKQVKSEVKPAAKKPESSKIAPPAPGPVLTGAWAKKPNLGGLLAPKPKPVAAPASGSDKPAPEKPAAAPATKPTSPQKKTEQPTPKKETPAKKAEEVKSPVNAKSPTATAKSPQLEEKVEAKKGGIASAWGSLDVSTSAIGEWSSKTTEKKVSTTPNAWTRGSPIMAPVSTDAASTASSRPTVVPGSPKDIQVPRTEQVSSPKQHLKMGKWEAATSESLSLQFGSFSLNGEAASPRGWTSTPSNSGAKSASATTKAAEAPNAWGTQSVSPKKKTESKESESVAARKAPTSGTSAPPGLSAESGRATPKSAQSPRGYAPSAPSPASLPKPEDVKRSTPTRAQGHFPQGSAQQPGSSKLNLGSSSVQSGYGSGFYGQYSMDIGVGGRSNASAGNAGNIASQGASNTPKSSGRGGPGAPGAVQSPSHGPQQVQASQMQQMQMSQQQQQQKQQQGQQAQAQQQHGQGHQQPGPQHQQNQPGPQGYHPHYAPPPPPGMAMPYNPYNYANYYQGYGYYQNPQYPQYNPRSQYPPRNVPYGVEGPMPGFSNPPNLPVGYQDQHVMAHQHEYSASVPQGFGEISGTYLQQPPSSHVHQQSGPQSHGKGSAPISSGQQAPHSQRSAAAGMSAYQTSSSTGSRGEHGSSSTPPVPNTSSGASSGSYGGQHYGWGSYGAQPVGGWGHMVPQGYQQTPQSQQHPGSHQQSYRQYGNASSSGNNSTTDTASSSSAHGHNSWSS